jgi:ABC-2 type transport system ATP-binding protein
MTSAIHIEGLSKIYRKGWRRQPVSAISDVCLDVPQGEAFGFIGPNGAGKSSTIRILMGLALPSDGRAEIFGINVANPQARRGVGYVPESPYLYDYLSPTEILEMGIHLHSVKLENMSVHVAHWVERLGLTNVANAPLRSFSKGMIQRVAIAQALAINPRLLVLDEPLSGLDPIGRKEVVELLADYKRAGGTLFFTSHVLHDVERLADRFGLIHQGTLRSVRSPAALVGGDDIVLIRSSGTAAVAGMSMETAGRWFGECTHEGLWSQLDLLRAAGHSITEVRPSLSLESAFLKIVGK